MKVAQTKVEFLGMQLKDGAFQPSDHIAKELLKFPYENLSHKQVKQFLGIVNYLREFVAKITRYMYHLQKMLKKDPPL